MLTVPELLIFFAFLLLLSVCNRAWKQRRLRGGLPLPPGLPPGPKGLPILGNVLDLDVSAPGCRMPVGRKNTVRLSEWFEMRLNDVLRR